MRTGIHILPTEWARGPRFGHGWIGGGRTKPAQNLPTQGQIDPTKFSFICEFNFLIRRLL